MSAVRFFQAALVAALCWLTPSPAVTDPVSANAHGGSQIVNLQPIEANFTVSVSTAPANICCVFGGGTFPSGSSVKVTARMRNQPFYEFLSWTEGGRQVSITPHYEFILTRNRSLTANFKPPHAARNDLLVDRGAQGLYFFKNNTTWQKIHNGSPTVMAAADVNGNGKDDVLFALTAPAAAVGLWQRLDNGALTRIQTRAAVRLAAGDVNNDGKDDVVATFAGISGTYIRSNGAGVFTRIHPQTARLVALGDLDGNRKADVIIALPDGLWVRYDNAGAWVKRDSVAPSLIATGYDRRSEKSQLVVNRPATGVWRYLDSLNSWERLDLRNASKLASGDADSDDFIDLFAAFPDGLWLRHKYPGTWTRLDARRPTHLVAVNLDWHWADAVVIIPGQGLRVLMNGGQPYGTGTWRVLLASPQPQDVISGGFD